MTCLCHNTDRWGTGRLPSTRQESSASGRCPAATSAVTAGGAAVRCGPLQTPRAAAVIGCSAALGASGRRRPAAAVRPVRSETY